MTGARRILEIGMFTGYSTLAWAEALPKDGRVVTCEINPETTEIAKRYFAESPHGHKIEIKLGPALEFAETDARHFRSLLHRRRQRKLRRLL